MLEKIKKMFGLASVFIWKNGGWTATLFKDIHVFLQTLQRKFLNIYCNEKKFEKYFRRNMMRTFNVECNLCVFRIVFNINNEGEIFFSNFIFVFINF